MCLRPRQTHAWRIDKHMRCRSAWSICSLELKTLVQGVCVCVGKQVSSACLLVLILVFLLRLLVDHAHPFCRGIFLLKRLNPSAGSTLLQGLISLRTLHDNYAGVAEFLALLQCTSLVSTSIYCYHTSNLLSYTSRCVCVCVFSSSRHCAPKAQTV